MALSVDRIHNHSHFVGTAPYRPAKEIDHTANSRKLASKALIANKEMARVRGLYAKEVSKNNKEDLSPSRPIAS
jgi:hypothetical protein